MLMTLLIESWWRFWADVNFSGWKRLKIGNGHGGQHDEEHSNFWDSSENRQSGVLEVIWATLPRIWKALKVRDCALLLLSLVGVLAGKGSEDRSQGYRN